MYGEQQRGCELRNFTLATPRKTLVALMLSRALHSLPRHHYTVAITKEHMHRHLRSHMMRPRHFVTHLLLYDAYDVQ